MLKCSGDAPPNAASSRFNNRCGLVWGLRGLPGIANYCRSSELFCIFVFVFVFAFVFLYLRRLPGIANYRRSSELLEMYRNAYCPLNHIQRVIAYFDQKLRLFELSVWSCLMSKVVWNAFWVDGLILENCIASFESWIPALSSQLCLSLCVSAHQDIFLFFLLYSSSPLGAKYFPLPDTFLLFLFRVFSNR